VYVHVIHPNGRQRDACFASSKTTSSLSLSLESVLACLVFTFSSDSLDIIIINDADGGGIATFDESDIKASVLWVSRARMIF
jgi:hypothetical protein